MASQSWVSLLNPGATSTGPGTTLTLAASTQVASPQTGVPNDYAQVNPAGFPLGWQVGLLVRVTARGYHTPNTTAGNVTFLLRANKGNSASYTAGATLATTSAFASYVTGGTGFQWKLEALIRCTSIGTSGGVSTQGELLLGPLPTTSQTENTASAGVNMGLPNASGETAATVDTTQTTGIQLAITGSAASGTLACTQWLVEALD